VDAVTLHPRFFEDKFRRRARHELLAWAASVTRLPLIANGDLLGAESVTVLGERLRPACAVMIGRMALVRPWLFATWEGAPSSESRFMGSPLTTGVAEVWNRLADYLLEDFEPAVALRRLQAFTKYYAANFAFGHRFHVELARTSSMEDARRCAGEFFARNPRVLEHPTVAGR